MTWFLNAEALTEGPCILRIKIKVRETEELLATMMVFCRFDASCFHPCWEIIAIYSSHISAEQAAVFSIGAEDFLEGHPTKLTGAKNKTLTSMLRRCMILRKMAAWFPCKERMEVRLGFSESALSNITCYLDIQLTVLYHTCGVLAFFKICST